MTAHPDPTRRDPAAALGFDEVASAAYRRDGYAVVRGRFADDEIAAWRDECDRLWALPGFIRRDNVLVQTRPRIDGGEALERIDWVRTRSNVFRDLADDPRVVGPAGDALGDQATLFKDKLLIRPPGTMGYGLHQDFSYWAGAGPTADEIVTVLVAIDAIGGANGGLEMFRAYHDTELPGPAEEPRDVDPAAVDPGRAEVVELAAGDLLVFHSLAPHGSPPNRSERYRRTIFLTYAPVRYEGLYDDFVRRVVGSDATAG